jgi:Pvc16 N-terminal domain
MIQEVDESLRALVKREALNGSKAEVAFDAPTKDWAARRNAPTVDLYLYDIREDLDRRETMLQDVRGDNGFIVARRPPPRRFKLSYLVTAWTQRPEDEHRLLSSLLSCFLAYQRMPKDVLIGSLAASGESVYLSIALPPPQDRSLSDVWSALGGELKPSLDLVINAPVTVNVSKQAGPPVLEEPRFTFGGPDGETEEVGGGDGGRGGKRKRVAAGAAGAKSVGAPGLAGPTESGRLKPGEPANKPEAPVAQVETIVSGKERQPGRIFRLRGINRS